MAALKFKNKKTGKYDAINDIDRRICMLWGVNVHKKEYAKPNPIEYYKQLYPDNNNIQNEIEYHTQTNWFDRLYMCTADKTLEELKAEYIEFFQDLKNTPDYNEKVLNGKVVKFFNYMIENYTPVPV